MSSGNDLELRLFCPKNLATLISIPFGNWLNMLVFNKLKEF